MESTGAPSLVAQELAEVRVLNELADESGWDKKDKDYLDARNQIRKKYKDLAKIVKMNRKSGASQGHTTKEKWIWADKGAPLDAGDFNEALAKLPEVFGEGKYGTSGVNSRGGKQKYKGEECVWKRVSKDGKHYRIFQHSTGYFYQKGFLPSDTEEQDEEQENEEDKDSADEGAGDEVEEKGEEEASEPPSKKPRKGGKDAKAPAKVPKAAKDAPKPSPKRVSKRSNK